MPQMRFVKNLTFDVPSVGNRSNPMKLDVRCAEPHFERDQAHPERLSRRRETRPFPPGEVINEALRIFASRWGLLSAAFLVKWALIGVPGILMGIVVAVLANLQGGQPDDGAILSVMGLSFTAFALITFVLFSYLNAGSFVLHLKVAREQPATLSDLFSGGPYWGRVIVCGLLVNVAISLGFLALIIPRLVSPGAFSAIRVHLGGRKSIVLRCVGSLQRAEPRKLGIVAPDRAPGDGLLLRGRGRVLRRDDLRHAICRRPLRVGLRTHVATKRLSLNPIPVKRVVATRKQVES